MTDVILTLVSHTLTTYGRKSSEKPPAFMTSPVLTWTFMLTDGLELAIQTQSRYHNVVFIADRWSEMIERGKYILEYADGQLVVTTEFKHDGWQSQARYTKHMYD